MPFSVTIKLFAVAVDETLKTVCTPLPVYDHKLIDAAAPLKAKACTSIGTPLSGALVNVITLPVKL